MVVSFLFISLNHQLTLNRDKMSTEEIPFNKLTAQQIKYAMLSEEERANLIEDLEAIAEFYEGSNQRSDKTIVDTVKFSLEQYRNVPQKYLRK